MTPRMIPNRRSSPGHALVLLGLLVLCSVPGFLSAQEPAPAESESIPTRGKVTILSDPTGLRVTLDGKILEERTPVTVDLYPGKYYLLLNADGYQPLHHELDVVAGQPVDVTFIMLRTPPLPPSPEELRTLGLPEEEEPNPAIPGQAGIAFHNLDNDRCLECHPSIPKIQARGVHQNLACSECHSEMKDHVRERKVIGKMQVVRDEGIQTLCLTCHDQRNTRSTNVHIKKIHMPKHLTEKGVQPKNPCNRCHHVHAPMTWVYEAREIIGLPEILRTEPLLNEETALDTQKKFSSLAETFLVFPLAPGIIGQLAFAGEEGYPADALVISGMALSVGSYMLGKVFSSQKLHTIRAINDRRKVANQRAQQHNQMVEKALSDHGAAIAEWAMESEGRGKVIVKRGP